MNSTAHDTARLLLKLADQGLTFEQVTNRLGGTLSDADLAACAETFRSTDNRSRFARWAGLST